MKHFSKLPAVVLACVAAVSIFAACSPGGKNTPPPGQLPETNRNVLIAYFSHTGNTESVAQSLQGMTGADLFEIERETPYDLSIDDPEEEINSNARLLQIICPKRIWPDMKLYLSAIRFGMKRCPRP